MASSTKPSNTHQEYEEIFDEIIAENVPLWYNVYVNLCNRYLLLLK